MTTSYRLSWGNSFDIPTLLEVITTEKYRCLGPVQVAQDDDGRMGWHLSPSGRGYDPSSHEPVCWTVEEMEAKGWIERVDEDA